MMMLVVLNMMMLVVLPSGLDDARVEAGDENGNFGFGDFCIFHHHCIRDEFSGTTKYADFNHGWLVVPHLN